MERCPEHDTLAQDVKATGLIVAEMNANLKNAIEKVTEHINAGSRWRLAILCSCIGLVGLFIGGIVRFSLIDYKVITHDADISKIQEQIYDLNYEKGRATGLAESK